MKRKPKKYVVVSDMYDTIYSDVVMEDLKEFYPDASDELLDAQGHQPLHIAHRANRAER